MAASVTASGRSSRVRPGTGHPDSVCGMGSIFGSIVGGLLIGVAISVTTLYIPAASEVSMYVLMALVLMIRPRGLFGEEGVFG